MSYLHLRVKTNLGHYANFMYISPDDNEESYNDYISHERAEITAYETIEELDEACKKQQLIDDFGLKIERSISGEYTAIDPTSEKVIVRAESVRKLMEIFLLIYCTEVSEE